MLVDDEILYIWSINFSYYSIEKNWEIWLILKDKEIIKEFLKIFKKDIN
jgi:phosphatidylserine/phosphatidylglycerophosphate/cardiolipin synthase-like enzyme